MTDDVSRLTQELAQALLREAAPKIIRETVWLIAEASAATEISDFYRLYCLLVKIESNSKEISRYITTAEDARNPKLVEEALLLAKQLKDINL